MIGLGIVAALLISAPTAPTVEPLKSCPKGAKLRGKAPPRSTAQWCEAADLFGKMQKNGPFVTWHDNGRPKATGYFVDGERHGDWKQWDENGRLVRQQSYKFGQAVGGATRQSSGVDVARVSGSSAAAGSAGVAGASGASTASGAGSATPPRTPRASPRERRTVFAEQEPEPVGGLLYADSVLYGVDGLAVYNQEFDARLVIRHFELLARWGFVFADASGLNSFEALNPTLIALGRADFSRTLSFWAGGGASIPVRGIDQDTAVGVALVASSAVPRGYWDAWMYLPRDPYVVLPFALRYADGPIRVGGELTFFFGIPIEGGTSQLNLQTSVDASYAVIPALELGLEMRAVALEFSAAPEGSFGLEPFALARFGPGFARAGFSVYPTFSDLLRPPSARGITWGASLGIGVEL